MLAHFRFECMAKDAIVPTLPPGLCLLLVHPPVLHWINGVSEPSHLFTDGETKNTGKKVSTSINGMYGSGSGSPAKIIIQYAKNIMAGIKKMMGIYHLFFLILL
jgi:hypothetical protein